MSRRACGIGTSRGKHDDEQRAAQTRTQSATVVERTHAGGDPVIGVVVVTHGQLANELVNAAETIVGDLPTFTAVSIGWHEDAKDARDEIASAIARVQGSEGVLIATDMFGGTPANLGITFLEPKKVEVVTGVNLPMLIKAANLREQRDITEVARTLREHGRNAIWVASDLLKGSAEAAGPHEKL